MKMVFQDNCKDLLEVFLALGRLKNKRTLYYDIFWHVSRLKKYTPRCLTRF